MNKVLPLNRYSYGFITFNSTFGNFKLFSGSYNADGIAVEEYVNNILYPQCKLTVACC